MQEQDVRIGPLALPGLLRTPTPSIGIIVFAHGSGSSRLSARNQAVARALNDRGFVTLLFDLLTQSESEDRSCVFDIALLCERLLEAIDWLDEQNWRPPLPIGLFGASTGAAAALAAAARSPQRIAAVVSRGGRPDLAGALLTKVVSPTLLIVGGDDDVVLELNRDALAHLGGPKELVVIPGASHLFPEPGTLEAVTQHAASWFQRHLGPQAGQT